MKIRGTKKKYLLIAESVDSDRSSRFDFFDNEEAAKQEQKKLGNDYESLVYEAEGNHLVVLHYGDRTMGDVMYYIVQAFENDQEVADAITGLLFILEDQVFAMDLPIEHAGKIISVIHYCENKTQSVGYTDEDAHKLETTFTDLGLYGYSLNVYPL